MGVNQLCYLKEYNEAVYKHCPFNDNPYEQHLK